LLLTKDFGFNGRSSRRHLVDYRHVQVAVNRHRQGTGNRRGRHHEDVRVKPTRSQFGSLHDTKTVLFVNNSERQVLEGHSLLNQCMRADNGVDLTGREFHLKLSLFRRAQRTGQEFHAIRSFCQQSFNVSRVLFSKNLCGGHQGGLITTFHRCEHGN
jgi:hypothetical protein